MKDPPSLVRATRQMWKLHIGTFAYPVAAAMMVWGAIQVVLNSNYTWYLAGILMGLLIAAFCSLAIRCPKCGAHWYWRAMRTLQRGWARRLFKQSECPSCGYSGPGKDA